MTRLLALAVLGTTVAFPLQADDLWTVYQAALDNDPVIREAFANRNAQREAIPQARALLHWRLGNEEMAALCAAAAVAAVLFITRGRRKVTVSR